MIRKHIGLIIYLSTSRYQIDVTKNAGNAVTQDTRNAITKRYYKSSLKKF